MLCDELTERDLDWYNYWQTRKRENFGPVYPGAAPRGRANLVSLIRQESMKAWNAIVESDAVRSSND